MKTKILQLSLILSVLVSGCSPLLVGKDKGLELLHKSADKYLSSPLLRGSSWSIMSVELNKGRILLSRDADRSLIPGSSMKLLTTACTLETLGPDYRTKTLIGYTGEIDSIGTVTGDLVIVGRGDPTISTRYRKSGEFPQGGMTPALQSDTTNLFNSWADSLIKRGVRRITGDLVGYDDLFAGEMLGSGWEWDDLPNWYAAEFSPLVYGDDCIELTIQPGDSVGSPARVNCNPDVSLVKLTQAVVTTSPDSEAEIFFDRELGRNNVLLWGSIPLNSIPQRRWVSVHDPAKFFLIVLRKALESRGIIINGAIRNVDSTQGNEGDFKLLFAHLSPRLSERIKIINQYSQNLHAEMLVRTLGLEASKRLSTATSPESPAGGTIYSGINAIREWESKVRGVSTLYSMADGSGLSRRNLAGASEFVKVLVYMNRSPYRNEFVSSLASPGVGTMQDRPFVMPKGIALYAKTGSLSHVRALSGYLYLDGKPQVAFSFICNNYLCNPQEVERTMDNLCQILALYLKEE